MPRSGIPSVRRNLPLLASRHDGLRYSIRIGVNLAVPEAQNMEALDGKGRIPVAVAACISILGVLTSVDLDNHPGSKTREIDDIGSDRHLPAEVQALLTKSP